jgi:nucleotide-binding universal stress UspA family protein
MMRVLIPVDGSAPAVRAVEYALALCAQEGLALELTLLNVQPALSGAVASFIDKSVIGEYHDEQAQAALAEALAKLEHSGIPYTTEFRIGHHADEIQALVADQPIDAIFMGTRGHGGVAGLLLGSVANQVLSVVDVPVTLIK